MKSYGKATEAKNTERYWEIGTKVGVTALAVHCGDWLS